MLKKEELTINNPITVIIADDEVAIRNGLEEIITAKRLGAEVLATADNGKDALSLILQHRPDISIIDINMPELNGLEVIRQAYEAGCSTRFIILSGYGEFTYAQTAIRYGVKSYFLKPLNIIEFVDEFSKQCHEILANRSSLDDISTQNLNSLVASSRLLFLNQLIQNRIINLDDVTTKLSVLNLSITNNNSFVVLFRIYSQPDSNVVELSDIHETYIRDSFPSFFMESWVYDDNQIIAIFNLSDHNNIEFRALLQQCINQIKEETTYKVTAGIGNVVPSLNQCFHSYSQAQEALSYHIYETGTDIYDSSMICDKKPTFSRENIDFKPLIYCITHQDTSGIADYCNAFFNSLFFIQMPPPNFIIGMCMYLIMNVQKQIALLRPDDKIEFTFEEISSFESVKVLEEWLIGFFVRYGEMLKDTTGDDNSIISTSKDFINKNLSRSIKAKDVAARVNLSETYFSVYFKDKTGINFRDYILKARINYAKTLLKSKETNISEIAYLTGYQDYRSFSRAFKNETGMTPSEYSSNADFS